MVQAQEAANSVLWPECRALYQHFKGRYYTVHEVRVYDAKTSEPYVIYTALYDDN